jgi:murein L,D-transpeptidase YcbB/YkuD
MDFGQFVGLMWRIVANQGDIEKLNDLAQPTLEKIRAVSVSASSQAAEIYDQLFPVLQEIRQSLPALVTQYNRVYDELYPGQVVQQSLPDMPWLQTSLDKLGYHLQVDGEYGDHTKAAVTRFQTNHGLTVDGWAGIETVMAIHKELKDKGLG